MTFTIYVGSNPIATTGNIVLAYEAWAKVKEFAELLELPAHLLDNDNSEIIADCGYDDEEEDSEPLDIDSDEGFDPYEGCFTWDC
jgi:hypothetical protein